ncbi:MAG: hypothetical protein KTR31_32540 [Myxococcales bacterium]|nr:hypothetical protein [Myxococcales bacterium]
MDDSAIRALQRLREPDSPALADLAALVVAQTTATPLAELARPEWIANQVAAGLEAATRGDHLRAWVDARIAEQRDRWAAEERPLKGFVPDEALEPLQSLLGRPYVPDEELVYRLIDQPAIRELVHTVLSQTVQGFRKRLGDVDGMLAGLSRRAAKHGKGLLGNVGRNLGGMAENIVGAVRDEVDHALEGRIADFMDNATTQALRTIADHAADPAQAQALAQLRLAVLDVVLDSPIQELAAEADKLKPEEIIDVVVGAVRSSLADPEFVPRLRSRIADTLQEAGDGTFGDWLDEVELTSVWTRTTTEFVADRLASVVQSDAFETWWQDLHR